MRQLIRILVIACSAYVLSGCMALALAPVANAAIDRPVSAHYTTSARKGAVFSAALKAISAKGTTTTVDRETGTIRGDITTAMGQTGYNVVVGIEERGGKTLVRIDAKLEGIMKFDLGGSKALADEILKDIERQIGARLEPAG